MTFPTGFEGAALTMWVAIGDSAAVRTSRAAFPMVQPGNKAAPRAVEEILGAERAPAQPARALDAAMDRFARGEETAFDDLYRLAAPRVRSFLLRMCGDPALADDLVQDTLLRVSQARGSFEEGASALPWVLAIARNAFFDHTRRARTRADYLRSARSAAPSVAAPETRGDEMLVAREMLVVVRETLDALPVAQREAFVLLRFEGLSVADASQVLGTTESSVKIRAFRAYEALRAAIEESRRIKGDRDAR
jgi:RNA polymerase sigma-70 factor (ECF subfamily)